MLLDFRRLIKDEHPTEASICSRIKHQLYFKSIYRREDDISDPEDGTCSWIMDQSSDYAVEDGCEVPRFHVTYELEARSKARSEYLSWLGQDVQISHTGTEDAGTVSPSPKILHISGKAGSGKSTLMRYLFRHNQTRAALEKWAGTRTLVLASFYFWVASGDDMQKSLQGLYRTILHDVLRQCPDLGAYLFPSQWREIQRSIDRREEARDSADAVLFRGKAIQEAFSKLVGSTAGNSPIYCFCFFIDGLDEHRERASNGVGDSKDLSPGFKNLAKQLLRWNKAAHVKICSTARPHTEFLDPLRRDQATVLHLEDVNQCDIYRHCNNAFKQDDDIAEMQIPYLHLVSEITWRAEGVFLWAILTVRALVTSLVRGDSEKVQMQKLDAIPPELDSLYQMLLDRVDESDRDRSNQLFLLELNRVGNNYEFIMDVTWISWLVDLTNTNFPASLVLDPALQRHRDRGRRLLSSLTHGMLSDSRGYVGFCHRTAYDYMKERQASGQLASTILDFEEIDVYGRLILAHHASTHESQYEDFVDEIVDLWSNDHQRYVDTLLRSVEVVRRKTKAAYLAKEPETADYPALPIIAVIELAGCKAYPTPITVDDGTVPVIDISMLGYTVISRLLGYDEVVRRLYKSDPISLSASNDKLVKLLFMFINDYRYETGYKVGALIQSLPDNWICSMKSYKLLSGFLPCPDWMFFAAVITNDYLENLLRGGFYRKSLVEDMARLVPPGAMKCKVALNDSRNTVVTLQRLMEVIDVDVNRSRVLEFGEWEDFWESFYEDSSFETRLERLAAATSLSADNQMIDAELDETMDDGSNHEKLEWNFFFKYLEFEDHRLDTDFKIHITCTDLFK